MKDDGTHRKIRKEILRNTPAGLNPWHSHDGQGDIDFYAWAGRNKVHLAEPDIVIVGDGEILAIEIELTSNPKRILGVAFANWLASEGSFNGQSQDLGRKSLLIVIPQTEGKRNSRRISGKAMQLEELKSAIHTKLGFVLFDIVAPREVKVTVDAWLQRITGQK